METSYTLLAHLPGCAKTLARDDQGQLGYLSLTNWQPYFTPTGEWALAAAIQKYGYVAMAPEKHSGADLASRIYDLSLA